MKKNKTFIVKIGIVIVLFGSFAAQVSAWDIPKKSSGRFFGNLPAEIINTGCLYESGNSTCNNIQSKNGPFITESFLKAGKNYSWSQNGSVVAEKSIFTYRGDSFFHKMFVSGIDGKIITGPSRGSYANDNSKVPLVSYAGNFRNSTSASENNFQLLADTQFCNTQTMITTDTPAIQFWDTSSSDNATVRARGVQLSGGNPEPGKILVSTDLQGNAIWATPRLEADGVTITFDYNGPSPVVTGQSSCN